MKNILITGVSTGIGYDAVRHFLEQGYRVFGSVRSEKDKLRLNADFPYNLTLSMLKKLNRPHKKYAPCLLETAYQR